MIRASLKNLLNAVIMIVILGWIVLECAQLFTPDKIQNANTYRIVSLNEQTLGIGTDTKETRYDVELSPYTWGNQDTITIPIDVPTYLDLITYRSSRFFQVGPMYVSYTTSEGFSTVEQKEIRAVNTFRQFTEKYRIYIIFMVIVLLFLPDRKQSLLEQTGSQYREDPVIQLNEFQDE